MAETNDVVDPLFLGEVVPTGKVLGTGSFGSVIEVKYKGLCCAAKQLHKIFLEPDNVGIEGLIGKYEKECILMASLCHPNITQFLGLCSVEDAQLPLLLMERLEMNVADLLECVPNLPLPNKISILFDTCCGLIYLHTVGTPMVHRDLTARNVLLTSSLTAKISDLGNSQLIERRSSYLMASMSKCPGTMVYMPPEALNGSSSYGPSLDVFSFGHLALYILIQEFPCNLLAATYPDPRDGSRIRGRSEQERRGTYLSKLNALFAQSNPVLIQMVQQCLRNMAGGRPSSVELMSILQDVKLKVERKYGVAAVNTANILVTKEIAVKEKKIKELQVSLENSATIRQRLENDKQQLQNEKGQIQLENRRLQEEKRQLQSEKGQLQFEKRQIQIEKQQLQTEKQQLLAEMQTLQSENQENKQQLQDRKHKLPDELVEYCVKLEVRFDRAVELLEENEKITKELEADRDHQCTRADFLEAEKEKLQNSLIILRRELRAKTEEVCQCYLDIQKLVDKNSVLEVQKSQLLDEVADLHKKQPSDGCIVESSLSSHERNIQQESRQKSTTKADIAKSDQNKNSKLKGNKTNDPVFFDKSESEDELFPPSKSNSKSLTEKDSEKMNEEIKDSSKSAVTRGIFGFIDDGDNDIAFTASKRLSASKPVSSGGGLFDSDDEDEDDIFCTPATTTSNASSTSVQSTATTSSSNVGQMEATGTDGYTESYFKKRTSWGGKKELDGLVKKEKRNEKGEEEEDKEKEEEDKEKEEEDEEEEEEEEDEEEEEEEEEDEDDEEEEEEDEDEEEEEEEKEEEIKENVLRTPSMKLFGSDYDEDEDDLFIPSTKLAVKTHPSSVAASVPAKTSCQAITLSSNTSLDNANTKASNKENLKISARHSCEKNSKNKVDLFFDDEDDLNWLS